MTHGQATMTRPPLVPQIEEEVIAHFKARYTKNTAQELIVMFQDQLKGGLPVNMAYGITLMKYIVITGAKYAVSHEKAT